MLLACPIMKNVSRESNGTFSPVAILMSWAQVHHQMYFISTSEMAIATRPHFRNGECRFAKLNSAGVHVLDCDPRHPHQAAQAMSRVEVCIKKSLYTAMAVKPSTS